jgi:hypothetical protein
MPEITLNLESLASSETAPSSEPTSELISEHSESEEGEEKQWQLLHRWGNFSGKNCTKRACLRGDQDGDRDPAGDQAKSIPPVVCVTVTPVVINSVDLIAAAYELAAAF